MRILFCIKTLSAAKGGAERVLTDIVNGLSARGHEVHVLTFDPPHAPPFYPLSDGVIKHFIGLGDVGARTSLKELWARVRSLRRILQTLRPDVAVGFMHSMFVPLSFAALGTVVPVIASEHIVPQHYNNKRLEFALLIAAGLLARRVTVLSDSVRAAYPKILRSRMVVMPNPVHIPPELPERPASQRRVILNVGRLDPQKDQITLIAAFALLAADYPDWDLHIIGEGVLRPELERAIAQENLEARIILRGSVSDIASAYSGADIFAMPSLYESFGLATAEAMAHGLPVVGFADCMGTNELVANAKTGLLVTGETRATALRGGLITLMDNAYLRAQMGAAAREFIQKFSLSTILDGWEIVLNQL